MRLKIIMKNLLLLTALGIAAASFSTLAAELDLSKLPAPDQLREGLNAAPLFDRSILCLRERSGRPRHSLRAALGRQNTSIESRRARSDAPYLRNAVSRSKSCTNTGNA